LAEGERLGFMMRQRFQRFHLLADWLQPRPGAYFPFHQGEKWIGVMDEYNPSI
jgi:hypothetical protein